jgi:hypothetical protein
MAAPVQNILDTTLCYNLSTVLFSSGPQTKIPYRFLSYQCLLSSTSCLFTVIQVKHIFMPPSLPHLGFYSHVCALCTNFLGLIETWKTETKKFVVTDVQQFPACKVV